MELIYCNFITLLIFLYFMNSSLAKFLNKVRNDSLLSKTSQKPKVELRRSWRRKQEADNPEVISLKGIKLDSSFSIDYYYPYFIRNNILKFDDDETKDIHLMISEGCYDPNCELCIPDHLNKCYKCHLNFLKLHGKCYKYCPDGYRADTVRRICYPKANVGI